MNNDTVKGTVNDAVGRARRQAGEWTGNTEEQVKGTAQQVKGKAQKVLGEAKDAVHAAKTEAELERERREHASAQHDR